MLNYKLILISLGLLFFSGCSFFEGEMTINESIPVNITSPIEDHSGGLISIDYEHERIHSGRGFQYSGRLIGLAAASETYMLANTTSNSIHWRDFQLSCDAAPILVELFEAPTITSYGTLQNVSNRNRYSSINSSSSIYLNPTITNDGLLLMEDEIIGTKHTAGSTGAIALEWILRSNDSYVVKITNNNGNGVNCAVKAFFYESD